MNFQDKSQSVSSLLALLRSAQDGDEDGSPNPPAPSSAAAFSAQARPSSTPSTSRPESAQPARNSQLSALLAQLGPSLPPAAGTATSSSGPRGSAFDGASHDLLDPFGPVARVPRRDSEAGAGAGERLRSEPEASEIGKRKRKADEIEDRADWSFTRCLPVLTELLRDDEFVKEVRKMKKDQHALERRLWARMEKVKADHTAKQAPERQIAKITRKPVSEERVAKWDRELKAALSDLFVRTVLPSLDGLETRQAARLAELGVPGLGEGGKGEDRKARQVRVRRIVGVLEGAVEE